MEPLELEGFLNLLKPPGMTSHDVVAKARRLLKEKRIGHLGTLDPDAAGVLPIAIGQATRLIELVAGVDKAYRTQLRLGAVTDSQDASGRIVKTGAVPALSRDDWEETLRPFRGQILQTPPMVSAVSVGGKRLYEYARQGIEVERSARPVSISRIEIVHYDPATPEEIVIDVECSAGTYIRTLCHDIGQRLGCGGHMGWLIRTRSGLFSLRDSLTLESLAEGPPKEQIVTPFEALAHLPALEIGENRLAALSRGLAQYLQGDGWSEGQWIRMHRRQKLLAVGQAIRKDEQWLCQPRKVFTRLETRSK
ncbi:tRNA pseudouridine synthase b [Heliomicrobium modesticaldum Ice1]|uniref:tRNA pseudouridine synthase B n=1 Tax=Heliobacterium modesticaldum (strain ATCC 51547 / Ice1) TaxID=498761 RepID=TRUB_HELMI|nr:tRNA pseudouridine(55) synthase TruB [Heliomicrobium modesticaldum]B0THR7.1 RecName: Full=tRNA pseudouridine synthase B; AltName: Full=tRNA pseudouridine(55) synthase; Short=Psi55 synthase; AltName: Full=tRNA pseudouridylate synthase; AltName: Full=tRNA-uridine isomerase [Heliomicrobium modesticaldum Ice1]ABZ84850.1 tRNA pseudouridine synthase b [Heliomicrobium modesticaldum Ice1]